MNEPCIGCGDPCPTRESHHYAAGRGSWVERHATFCAPCQARLDAETRAMQCPSCGGVDAHLPTCRT